MNLKKKKRERNTYGLSVDLPGDPHLEGVHAAAAIQSPLSQIVLFLVVIVEEIILLDK